MIVSDKDPIHGDDRTCSQCHQPYTMRIGFGSIAGHDYTHPDIEIRLCPQCEDDLFSALFRRAEAKV